MEAGSEEWTIKVAGYYTKDCSNYSDMIPIISELHDNNFKHVFCIKDIIEDIENVEYNDEN